MEHVPMLKILILLLKVVMDPVYASCCSFSPPGKLTLTISIITVQQLPTFVMGHSWNSVPRLLLVSMDGFRWDYLKMMKAKNISTPNFDTLIEGGVTIKDAGMKNVYITKTRVNHYSMVTGMYAEQHGIVGNHIYDPEAGLRLFNHTEAMNPFWYDNGTDVEHGPEPIWVTNQKANSTTLFPRRSGAYYFPASDVKIHGQYPYKFVPYEKGSSLYGYKERIDRTIEWFFPPVSINLGLLYFPEPDHTGHYKGIHSKDMEDMIQMLDGLVGHLIRRLKEANLFNSINVILTSDHGMAEVYPDKQHINLTEYVPASDIRAVGQECVINVFPAPGKYESTYEKLKAIPNTKTYRKEEIPEEFHYKHNVRIAPLIIEADKGWQIVTNETGSYISIINGTHGYSNNIPDMHPIFIAYGPAFKQGHRTKQFNTVDLYPLMCHLLELTPAPGIAGSLENIRDLLREKEGLKFLTVTALTFIMAILFTTTMAGCFAIAACRAHRIVRRRPPVINLQTLEDVPFKVEHVEGKTRLLDDYELEDEFS